MKKTIIFTIVALLLYNNYEYINEIFFLSNLSKYELHCNKTYNYDLNEDGNLEEIKLETYKTDNENYVVNLYINNELKYEFSEKFVLFLKENKLYKSLKIENLILIYSN